MDDSQMRMLFQNIKHLLKTKMNETGMSQKELAAQMDMAPGEISDLLNYKKKRPAIDTIYKIARYFNVSIDWLCDIPGASKTRDSKNRAVCEDLGLSALAFELLSNDENRVIHNALDFLCYQHRQSCLLSMKQDEFFSASNVNSSKSSRRKKDKVSIPYDSRYSESLANELSVFSKTFTDENEKFAITQFHDGSVRIIKNKKEYEIPSSDKSLSTPWVTAMFGEIMMNRCIGNIVSILTEFRKKCISDDLRSAMAKDQKEIENQLIKEIGNDTTSET